MTEVDHISAAWVERKLLDALDRIDDRLGDVELKLEAVFRASDANTAPLSGSRYASSNG